MNKRKMAVPRSSRKRAGFRGQYQHLKNPPKDAKPEWYQNRGREFEKILSALLQEDGLDPRLHYRLPGEEIDGSFLMGYQVFLLEAKWEGQPISASTLYQFKGKVDGKLIGTLGVFISMSGYSRDAVDALTVGKDLNVILLDGSDLDVCVQRSTTFKTLLLNKLRLAAEEGVVYAGSRGRVVIETKISETFVWRKK